MLPESIGNLHNLNKLCLDNNQLNSLPESISSLANLTSLRLDNNQLTSLPKSIGSLLNLHSLCLNNNQLISLPESISNFPHLITLELNSNQLTSLPESIGNLCNLTWLGLGENQLTSLPESIGSLSNLNTLNLGKNPYLDLSNLQKIPNLGGVHFFGVRLSRRYWDKLSEWKCEWLLDEDNAEVRRVLIEQLGYDKICRNLNTVTLDIWREYTLLKIDGIEKIYGEDSFDDDEPEPIGTEPMVLLTMTCPSTSHVHILRVPPEMMSAEAAITWVNHGIHPDEFAIQT